MISAELFLGGHPAALLLSSYIIQFVKKAAFHFLTGCLSQDIWTLSVVCVLVFLSYVSGIMDKRRRGRGAAFQGLGRPTPRDQGGSDAGGGVGGGVLVAILKQSRKSGQLNLSNRQLTEGKHAWIRGEGNFCLVDTLALGEGSL